MPKCENAEMRKGGGGGRQRPPNAGALRALILMVAEGLLAKLEGCLRDSEALAEELASAAQAERTPEADAAAREGAAQVARVRERLEGVCKAVERADEALAKARLADVEVLRVLRNHLPDGVAGKWKDGVDVPRPDRRILLGEPGSEEQREIAGAIDDPDVARPPPGWEDDPDFFVDDEENQDPVPGVPDVHDPARPQWPGVEWSDDAGVDDQATTTPARLVGLDLADSGLHLLPSQIGMLDAVDDLDVAYNALATLPEELGKLQAVRTLNVRNNQLVSLPDSLGRLISLVDLDAKDNRITSLPSSIGDLHAARLLSFSINRISTLPPALARLTRLKSLWLNTNDLSEVLPSWFGEMTSLVLLQVHTNPRLAHIPAELRALTGLKQWVLMETAIKDVPEDVWRICDPYLPIEPGGVQSNPFPVPPWERGAPLDVKAKVEAMAAAVRGEEALFEIEQQQVKEEQQQLEEQRRQLKEQKLKDRQL